MELFKNEQGTWCVDGDTESIFPIYRDMLLAALNELEPVFYKACEINEFDFLMSLFNIKSMEDAGWDPYQSTVRALTSVGRAHKEITGEAQRHIELWLYGHIIEASAPYEVLANLLDVINGGTYNSFRFPPGRKGRPQSPGDKITAIEKMAREVGLPNAIKPLRDIWDRKLRNSIFHADYILWGPEVRTRNPIQIYSHEEVTRLSNGALAYIEAFQALHSLSLKSYRQPKIIETPNYFAPSPAVVLVSENYGAVGMQAALTKEDLESGQILWRMGLFTPEETASLNKDPTNWLLPPRAPITPAIST